MTPAEWIVENKTFLPWGRKVLFENDVYRVESYSDGFYKMKRIEGKYCGNNEAPFKVMSDCKMFTNGELIETLDKIVQIKYF